VAQLGGYDHQEEYGSIGERNLGVTFVLLNLDSGKFILSDAYILTTVLGAVETGSTNCTSPAREETSLGQHAVPDIISVFNFEYLSLT